MERIRSLVERRDYAKTIRGFVAFATTVVVLGASVAGCESDDQGNYGVGTRASDIIASGMASACDFVLEDPIIDCEELEWNSEVMPAYDPNFAEGGIPEDGWAYFYEMGQRYACHHLYDYACEVTLNGRMKYGEPVVLGVR